MGSGIARVAATSGYTVTCVDAFPPALDKAHTAIAASTARLVEKEKLTPTTTTSDLPETRRGIALT
jgi:3-hydroxyacyl-CoA dehydrogenase